MPRRRGPNNDAQGSRRGRGRRQDERIRASRAREARLHRVCDGTQLNSACCRTIEIDVCIGLWACPLRGSALVYAGRRPMNRRDDDYFRLKPAAPKAKQSRSGKAFPTRVLRAANLAGGMRLRTLSTKPRATLARLGRGAAAAAFAGSKLVPYSRRVVIKSRIVNLKHVTPQAVDAHLRYIAREGVGHDGQPTQPYGPDADIADRHEFARRAARIVISFALSSRPKMGSSSPTCVTSRGNSWRRWSAIWGPSWTGSPLTIGTRIIHTPTSSSEVRTSAAKT